MRLVRFAHKKKRHMSPRWDDDQRKLLVQLWKAGSSFEDIAREVNELLRVKGQADGFDIVPDRTARAVAYQCVKLGFMTLEQLKLWEKERQITLRRDRYTGLRQSRSEVLQRDGAVCVICHSDIELEYAHVIPFSKTRNNLTKESITLCNRHHRDFDDGKCGCVDTVYHKMCEYYSDFEQIYRLSTCGCGKSSISRRDTLPD